jgi:hypothetical protein
MKFKTHVFRKTPLLNPILSHLITVCILITYSSLILLLAYTILYAHMSEMASYHHVTHWYFIGLRVSHLFLNNISRRVEVRTLCILKFVSHYYFPFRTSSFLSCIWVIQRCTFISFPQFEGTVSCTHKKDVKIVIWGKGVGVTKLYLELNSGKHSAKLVSS